MTRCAQRFLFGYIKWFVVPVAVGVLGYTIVGPRLSQMNSPLIKSIDKLRPVVGIPAAESSSAALPAGVETEKPAKDLPEPEVRVNVKKSGS